MTGRGNTVLVFDSGMGGLSVVRALRDLLPEAHLDFGADSAAFPYGDWDEGELVERICWVAGALIERTHPEVVVIACNTASTIALQELRDRFNVPFVGTVPAIKPAAERTRSGVIGVLATPGTVAREYTRALIDTYAYHCRVVLHGCEGLARLAERKLRGEGVALDLVREEILPVFVECDGRRTDAVVLGCTHYPLLLDEISEAAPWDCALIDPSDAIARRVRDVLPEGGSGAPGPREGTAFVTDDGGLAGSQAFSRYGFAQTQVLELPVKTRV